MKNYMEILKDSLKKKEEILEKLLEKCEIQKGQVEEENIDWDSFDEVVDEKGELIEHLIKIDEGFQEVFDELKEELETNKEKYKDDIRDMQERIRRVSELSMELETVEHRNKTLIENKFRESRQQIKQTRIGSQAAASYYNKMNKINTVDPQLMDRKS